MVVETYLWCASSMTVGTNMFFSTLGGAFSYAVPNHLGTMYGQYYCSCWAVTRDSCLSSPCRSTRDAVSATLAVLPRLRDDGALSCRAITRYCRRLQGEEGSYLVPEELR